VEVEVPRSLQFGLRPRAAPAPATTAVVLARRRLLGEALAVLLQARCGVAAELWDSATRSPDDRGPARPDVLVVAGWPRVEEALAALPAAAVVAPVVLLVGHVTADDVRRCATLDIAAVLDDGAGAATVAYAIGQAVAGGRAYLAEVAEDDGPQLAALSDRQREVFDLLAAGRSNREIAALLHISINTVKFHVRAILTELGARNRLEAALRRPIPPGRPDAPPEWFQTIPADVGRPAPHT
jgi:DNA-binding NarL/FixJ family response regulator